MSTLHVNLPESLHTQIITLAAHEGLSPDEFIVEALADKVEDIENSHHSQGERIDCSGGNRDGLQTLTIVRVPDLGINPHDHLAPYNEG